MINKKFKDIEKETNIDKRIVKAGLSLAIIFSKEEIKRFNLNYGGIIRLDNAEIINK
jgi:hypothetical protein